MASMHDHNIIDSESDSYFLINPIARSVINNVSKKTSLMQYDHNSERFTFEVDRYIEGHDMLQCNEVRVHYTNISSNRAKHPGIYNVVDLEQVPEDDTKLRFSWLISNDATFYAGQLTFSVSFACIENGEYVYRWNTNINTSITILQSLNNGDAIVEKHPDLLLEWETVIRNHIDESNRNFNEHISDCEQNYIDHSNECDQRIDDNIDTFKAEMREFVQGCVIEPTEFATTEEVAIVFNSEGGDNPDIPIPPQDIATNEDIENLFK